MSVIVEGGTERADNVKGTRVIEISCEVGGGSSSRELTQESSQMTELDGEREGLARVNLRVQLCSPPPSRRAWTTVVTLINACVCRAGVGLNRSNIVRGESATRREITAYRKLATTLKRACLAAMHEQT